MTTAKADPLPPMDNRQIVRSILGAQVNASKTSTARKAPDERRIASYTRFSTDKQKQTSTERQLQRNGHYSKKTFGKMPDEAFSDVGESGATIDNRSELLRLLAACEGGLFTDIVIEHFDRWSREVYDAVPIAEKLEKWCVKLHSWSDQRELTKRDQVEMASRAEEDRKRRTSLLSSGIDQLVENGGIPFKAPLGYRPTQKRGYPEVCPTESAGVIRGFELLLDHSDAETATILAREGFLTESGDTDWTTSMVRRMRRNMLYIGIICWRRTKFKEKRVGRKKPRTEARELDEVVFGFNERYRIIPDERFYAVDQAKRRRSSVEAGKPWSRTETVTLFPEPVCDCPGVNNQKFYVEASRGAFRCSLDCDRQACSSIHPATFEFESSERALLDLFVEGIAPAFDEARYKPLLAERLVVKANEVGKRKAELQIQRDIADADVEKLLDERLSDISSERLKVRIRAAEGRVQALDADIARQPAVASIDIATADSLTSVREAIDLLKSRIPFKPACENDRKMMRIVRALTHRVVIQRAEKIAGSVGFRLELKPEALYLTPEQIALCDLPTVVVEKEIRIRRRNGTTRSRAEVEELARTGYFALSDDQWARLAPLLSFGDWTGGYTTRQVANMVLFKMRTGVALKRLPPTFGERTLALNAATKFIYGGGAEIMLAVLRETDPAACDGLYLGAIEGMNRGVGTNIDGLLVAPHVAAKICAETGKHRLTDLQWGAVLGELNAVGAQQSLKGISLRQLIDGILIKLRTRCGWTRMPSDFSRGRNPLYYGMLRLQDLGLWDLIKSTLQSRFPETLEGLDTAEVDGFAETKQAKRELRQSEGKRIAQVRRLVISNITSGLSEGLAANASVIYDRCRITVRADGDTLNFRPDLAAGPHPLTYSPSRTSPLLVVDVLGPSNVTRERANVGLYYKHPTIRQILLVGSKRTEIDSHVRTARGWRSRRLTRGDQIIEFASFSTSMTVDAIYEGSCPKSSGLGRKLAKDRFKAAERDRLKKT